MPGNVLSMRVYVALRAGQAIFIVNLGVLDKVILCFSFCAIRYERKSK